MSKGLAERLFLVILILIVVFGYFEGNSFASDKAKESELSKALGKAKLFAGLSDKERASLISAATLRLCKAGEIIIEQGKQLDKMFIIVAGEAEVRVNGILVTTLPEQSLVGEIEFLDKLPARADVIILKETNLIELNNDVLTSLMKKQPMIGYVLMMEIARIEGARLRAMDVK